MERKRGIYERFIKRPADLALSLCALVLLSPVFLITSLLVRVKLGSPVIFKQQRPGKNEKVFTIFKFRTMTDARDENGELLTDEERLTRFGKFLRSTSIDELPELVNIIKGDMSIVGPRPLLVGYLALYNDEQRKRHNVRPGLTGLAQVNGRNAISWEKKFELDIEYSQGITFITDLKIIALTFARVVSRAGVNASSDTTMEPFTGTDAVVQEDTVSLYKLNVRQYEKRPVTETAPNTTM